MSANAADLAAFTRTAFVHGGRRHDVFRAGSGPGVSQPALPAPLTARKRAALGLDDADLAHVKQRTRDGLGVLGLRFTADKGCPRARFQTLRRELGPHFEGIEINSSPGNRHGIPRQAHAVLTVDLVDEPGHPTRAAVERLVALLDKRLRASATA